MLVDFDVDSKYDVSLVKLEAPGAKAFLGHHIYAKYNTKREPQETAPELQYRVSSRLKVMLKTAFKFKPFPPCNHADNHHYQPSDQTHESFDLTRQKVAGWKEYSN